VTAFFEGLVLGAVQGIVEWLPISSEGVNTLILIHFFDKPLGEAIAISLWLHMGTVLAALVYFRKEVADVLRHLPQYVRELGASSGSDGNALITFLILSTLLTGMLGAPLLVFSLDERELPAGTVMAIIGAFLITTGLVQRYTRRSRGQRTKPGIRDAVLLGVVQSFSAFPGLSRSGLTLSAFLFRGFDVKQAIRLSFLMSIPVVLGAEIGLVLLDKVTYDLMAIGGVITAFVFGILTIGILLRIARRIAFWKFCLFLGVLSLLPLLIERL